MIVSHEKKVAALMVKHPDAKDVFRKVLVSPKEGWSDYVMRVFDVGKGGNTPRHSHPWPHINYILKGNGVLFLDGKEYELEEGSFAYIPDEALHQFTNTGDDTFSMICIVPPEGDV